MTIDNVTGMDYRMAFYLPHQVGTQDAETGLFAVSGTPRRTVVVAGEAEHSSRIPCLTGSRRSQLNCKTKWGLFQIC